MFDHGPWCTAFAADSRTTVGVKRRSNRPPAGPQEGRAPIIEPVAHDGSEIAGTPTVRLGSSAREPGRLRPEWQIVLLVAWTAAFFAFSAVWKVSQEIGIGTWWLGPRADPQPTVVKILPFVLAVVVGLVAIYNVRRAALISLAGSIGVAIIATVDLSRAGGLAAIEFTIAACTAVVSVAALTGAVEAPPPLESLDDLAPPSGPRLG